MRGFLPWGLLAADLCMLVVVAQTFTGSTATALSGVTLAVLLAGGRLWAALDLSKGARGTVAAAVLATSVPLGSMVFGPRIACIAGADYHGTLVAPRLPFEPDASRVNAIRCQIPLTGTPWAWSGGEVLFQILPALAPAMALTLGRKRRSHTGPAMLETP